MGPVIAAHALAADAAGAEDFVKGPEEIKLNLEQVVAFEQIEGNVRVVAIAAHEVTHRQPVAQFNPGLIILAILPAA